MRRTSTTWVLFAAAVAVMLVVTAWGSVVLLRLDRENRSARESATFEEDVRLALWRLDSTAASIVGAEIARPAAAYRSFVAAARPASLAEPKQAEPLLRSPLLAGATPPVRLHFQLEENGRITSPQSPTGWMRRRAVVENVGPAQLATAGRRLAELEGVVALDDLEAIMAATSERVMWNESAARSAKKGDARFSQRVQQELNVAEFEARSRMSQNTFQLTPQGQSGQQVLEPQVDDEPQPLFIEGGMQPAWVDEELMLLRRVSDGETAAIQGCWLDLESLETLLLGEVVDVLPDARLEPAIGGDSGADAARRMASLPLRLVPGDRPLDEDGRASPLVASLAVAWGCLLVAAAAVFVLLRGAVSLSERRAAFVSAVTHELRTPLTTLRMYSEMLAAGMVADPEARREYLESLHGESERLAHLVENVLAYSRLERGAGGGEVETVTVATILERVSGPLERLAGQAGSSLAIASGEAADSLRLRVDLAAVERILYNLVDNACKYGGSDRTPAVELDVVAGDGQVLLRVRDHGRGLSATASSRLFEPFSKSAVDAAHSAPGVGLGLALSRRLAREMGGDLYHDDQVEKGARFVLRLPVVEGAPRGSTAIRQDGQTTARDPRRRHRQVFSRSAA